MKLFYSLQNGRSPLHVAAENGHTDVVDISVKHGVAHMHVDTAGMVSHLCYVLCASSCIIIT